MADDNDKKYPNSSPGMAKLFNLNQDEPKPTEPDIDVDAAIVKPSIGFAEKTGAPPAGLPISIEPASAESVFDKKNVMPVDLTPINTPESTGTSPDINLEPLEIVDEGNQIPNTAWKLGKSFLPYIVIFAIGIGLYFFYFSNFSFLSLFNNDSLKIESVSEEEANKNLDQLKEDVAVDYKIWLGQFFENVNDQSIIAMDADVSGNGLSNLEKYLLNLNPKVFSTRGNTGDGQLVLEGVNPWTGKAFTEKQKALVDKYINPELISNRITAAAITRGVTKYAQYVNPDSPYYIDPQTLSQVGDNRSVIVNPTQIQTTNVPTSGTSTGSTSTNTNSNNTGIPTAPATLRPDESIDETKPGVLEIPANNITVPIIWTQDVKDFDGDLKRGVVHYPGTAMPGDVGTTYISGHSSGYVWDDSPYKQVFAKLGGVANGTSFTITATQKNGKTVKYNYVIERREEFAANDQAQFISTAESIVALSTCWPVGTVDRRLVMFGKLTQTERN